GVASTKYQVYTGTVPGKSDGTWLVYDSGHKPSLSNGQSIAYYSVDTVANAESVKHSSAAMVDTTAPVTTDDVPSTWQNANVSVTLPSAARFRSGVASTKYQVYTGTVPGKSDG